MAFQDKNLKPRLKLWAKQTFFSSLMFIFGFIVGTIIDIIFYRLYIKWDPKKESLKKLLTVISIQSIVLTSIVSFENIFGKIEELYGIVFRISLVTSQIFMVQYALERISDKIYHREENRMTLVRRSLLNLPESYYQKKKPE